MQELAQHLYACLDRPQASFCADHDIDPVFKVLPGCASPALWQELSPRLSPRTQAACKVQVALGLHIGHLAREQLVSLLKVPARSCPQFL